MILFLIELRMEIVMMFVIDWRIKMMMEKIRVKASFYCKPGLNRFQTGFDPDLNCFLQKTSFWWNGCKNWTKPYIWIQFGWVFNHTHP